ncbi:MFS transporter [Caldovatus aquaticus]|uniref:MFS transporter n=1 Tax=Caldovatus aquaticus TaxID=2865671 RepID=A0ABS7F1B4_9PROT|nr:MFS transporter [Caldovatus aquaticus]MBW8268596.1 MFS transporter [Caldovatus aquaticus]
MAALGSAPRFAALTRALSHRNARIFFAASLLSWTGLWLHRVAVIWLAWELTGSASWVGLVAFCDLIPAVVVSPLAGAIADRVDRMRLTMATQLGIATQAASLGLLAATGHLGIAALLALEVVGGTAQSFAQPARQTLVPAIVPPADLPAAVALNSLCFNVARFVGPAVAGPLIALYGPAPAVLLNACAYVVATFTMPLLSVAQTERRGHAGRGSLLGDVAAGLRYAARHPGLGPILALAAAAALLVRGVQEILPPYVERLFGMGVQGLAVLTGAFGIGALVAGVLLAARGRLAGTTRLSNLAIAGQGLALTGFVATGWFPLGVLCAGLLGAVSSMHGIAVQTLVQSASDPAMRGRILSLWGLIVRVFPALGALVLGLLGEAFGLRWPTMAAGLLAIAVFALGMMRLPRMAAALEDGSSPRAAGDGK